jgi:membrane protease YdiL (CAAX protease family)
MAAVSASYALCMGWQPLVATWVARRWVDRVNLDDVLQTSKPRFYGIATVSPLVLAGVAILVQLLVVGDGSPPASGTPFGNPGILLVVALSMGVGVILIWIQALAEEVGWRGYFLPRFMEQCGPVTGLALHGLIWGLWYAPILLMAGGGAPVSKVSGGSFVVTCALLGVLFGWLRLAARSVVPPTLANSVLTLAAGLPFIVEGAEPGVRAAIYGPAGWLPLGLAVLIVLATRLRRDLQTPPIEVVGSRMKIWLVVLPRDDDEPDDERTLH